jgi:hypothetical protein
MRFGGAWGEDVAWGAEDADVDGVDGREDDEADGELEDCSLASRLRRIYDRNSKSN